ncbi:P-loop containing nucleoside triphosphate hydrolase protein [Cunninghamella echinulata]|nr:P-loop containing nucleoside triphosphate hydrolase protein [Cunninghamella echinulata]
MVMSNVDATSEKQKHLSNLLSLVQKRSAEYQRSKVENDNDLSTSITVSPLKNNTDPIKNFTTNKSTTTKKIKEALPDYTFTNDPSLPHLDINLKPTIEPRPYQFEALNAIISSTDPSPSPSQPLFSSSNTNNNTTKTAHSGIIVLPCGAGKTLTSIMVACAIQKPVLVVCSTIIAAEQFQKEFLHFTTLMATRMGMFAGSKKWPFNGPSGVLFTTYTMLVDSKNRTQDSKRMAQFIDKTSWGLMILDEVHCGPAANFSKAILKIKTKVRLGLTATMLREDEKIGDLDHLVGPIVYQAKWKELADRGYIAKVICTQVESKLSPRFYQVYQELTTTTGGGGEDNNSYLGQKHHIKSLLAILNPKKMQLCQRLIQYHEAKGDKVLVYCDHIEALKIYADTIQRPYIYGGTPTQEAQELLERFQIDASIASITKDPKITSTSSLSWSQLATLRKKRARQINTLFLSRIGDTSLDLPAATVLIQVSSHFGSRRQEAQRLGRVLRAKKRNEKGFYSRFYTLITNDTHEVAFSERRRQFLEEECGYGYQLWLVGDELEKEKLKNKKNQIDDNDEIKLDPLSCHIDTNDQRPYHTPEQEEKLLQYILNLKNIQVENDDSDESVVSTTSASSSGSKRRRIAK